MKSRIDQSVEYIGKTIRIISWHLMEYETNTKSGCKKPKL